VFEQLLGRIPGFDSGYVESWLRRFDQTLARDLLSCFHAIAESVSGS